MEILLMKVIKTVDDFLSLTMVRWFLLVSTIALMLTVFIYKGRLAISDLQLQAAKGDVAAYAAHIEVQNAAIIKATQEYEESKKKLLTATQQAEKLKKQLDDMGKIIVLPGTGEDMVKQVIKEVKK